LRPMNTKGKVGRPSTKPARLKNGFYVSVKNKGMSNAVMMYSPTRDGMTIIAQRYSIFPDKEVTIMGEHKNDEWVSSSRPARKKREKAA
jgi:hypothetical protein